MLSLDAAIAAASGWFGGQNVCCGTRLWLLRKASELGLDVLSELLRTELTSGDDAGDDSDEAETELDRQLLGKERPTRAPNPMVSQEVSDNAPGGAGRLLLQIELEPAQQRLNFSHTSLEPSSLGALVLECGFFVGLTSMFLVEAEAGDSPWIEFARWKAKDRGPLQPVEQQRPGASGRAVSEYFARSGPPISPTVQPPTALFCATKRKPPLSGAAAA